jgi:hypothetical protein
VCENRVLRIFRPKRKEVGGDWRRLYNEELHNLQTSPNIISAIKKRRLVGNRMGGFGFIWLRIGTRGGPL